MQRSKDTGGRSDREVICMKSSNIGGQAVMEGIMMRNQDQYSIAVRKPDQEIEVKVEPYKSVICLLYTSDAADE